MTDDLAAVNEPRRLLRDAIWNHGPEHFDLAHLFTGSAHLAFPLRGRSR